MKCMRWFSFFVVVLLPLCHVEAQVADSLRGNLLYERKGQHDANNIRTRFWNYGMVGDYPSDPLNVDLSTFHSVEVPKGSGVNYSDGTTPFVLAKIADTSGTDLYVMETGYRERQATTTRFINGQWQSVAMRFEPRPGYFQTSTTINTALSPAISSDPNTWPDSWADKDGTWDGYWNGYFGKYAAADQESYTVMDDNYYSSLKYYPDSRDSTRRGLGMRVEVRGFQWSNVQSEDVIFWHYDITNEGTVNYPETGKDENIIFGLYMDAGVGGEAVSCDGIAESDDDNAYWDRSGYAGLNLVYTWDLYGHGVGLNTTCATTGYLGYAYLETPGKPYDGVDNDGDGITDESRGSDPGQLIVGKENIMAYAVTHYDTAKFNAFYGDITTRPAYIAGRWWTGDENMNWVAEYDDFGADGLDSTNDEGEHDGIPTQGEACFGKTDPDESDQIGLTGFKMNRIKAGKGNSSTDVDGIVFYTDSQKWPERLYEKFTSVDTSARFDAAVVANYNIGFLFASGPFTLPSADRERFSLALAYGADLTELRVSVSVVQAIYNAQYKFSVPPPMPTVKGEGGNGYVQLTWDDVAEHGTNPIVGFNAFEGYRVYRSTDPEFTDPKVILTARGTSTIGNGKPSAQFDLKDGISGYTTTTASGVAYYLGSETGLSHIWRDTTVTNGQLYYYAVCAYDYGPTLTRGTASFTYYPSESAIAVSRTTRGGVILPKNVVAVRPNKKVLGYTSASASGITRLSGDGVGTVGVNIVRSSEVPNNHVFHIAFNGSSDSVHALTYTLRDSTIDSVLFSTGNVFDGSTNGQTMKGILPVVYTADTIAIDSATGFLAGSTTNAKLITTYNSTGLSRNFKRNGYPDDVSIKFSDSIIDTSLALSPYSATPVKFTVTAHSPGGDQKLKFLFKDQNGDQTLSHNASTHETIILLTGSDTLSRNDRTTWKIQMTGDADSTTTPTAGDVYYLKIDRPFSPADSFSFTTKGESVSSEDAKAGFQTPPYVVPNPYVGAASFEPAPYNVTGRGDRRIEFRNLPKSCTIRIYTLRGDLVQTLHHDGSVDGYVEWNLRSKDNLDVAPGLYIFHVDAGSIGEFIGKFALIK